MASLLERIQQLGQGGPQPQQKGIEKVLRQRTGKATSRKGPATSSVGEQTAISAGREALREQTFADRLSGVQARSQEQALAEQQALEQQRLRQQEDLTQQQLASEAALTRAGIQAGEQESLTKREANKDSQIRQLNAQAEQTLRDLSTQRGIETDNIFSEFEFDTADLEDRKDAAALEQRSFMLAMQDKKYLDELNKIGEERRLQNAIDFDNELKRLVMEDEMASLLDELNFQVGQKADQRKFNEQLAQIDVDTAVALAQSSADQAIQRNKWESIGSISTVAAQKLTEPGDTADGK